IGLASARRFIAEGAALVLTGPDDAATRTARDALGPLGLVAALTLEASDRPSIAAAFPRAVEALGGRLDVLVHVAGISGRRFGDGPLHECTDEGWEAVLDTNARGVFLTNRAA